MLRVALEAKLRETRAAAEACLRTAASDEAAAERRVDDSRADVDDAEAYAEAIGQAVAEAVVKATET